VRHYLPNFRFRISDFGLGKTSPKSKIQNPKY
jgi:hypothetical protein